MALGPAPAGPAILVSTKARVNMVSVSGRRLVPKGKRVNASAGLRTGHNWLWRAVTKPTTVATGIRADCGPSSGRVAGSAGERHYRCIRLGGKAGVGGRADADRVPRLRPAGEFTQTARSEPTAATEMPWLPLRWAAGSVPASNLPPMLAHYPT